MDTMSNDVAWYKNCRSGAVRLNENQRRAICRIGGSRGVTVVFANDASEFGPGADVAFNLRYEVFVEHRVVAADPAMGSVSVIMPEPGSYDVVKPLGA